MHVLAASLTLYLDSVILVIVADEWNGTVLSGLAPFVVQNLVDFVADLTGLFDYLPAVFTLCWWIKT